MQQKHLRMCESPSRIAQDTIMENPSGKGKVPNAGSPLPCQPNGDFSFVLPQAITAIGTRMLGFLGLMLAIAFSPSSPVARADDSARIYVYVQDATPAHSWFPVWCDGKVVAKIKHGRFFVINVPPGRHMLSEEKGVPVFVDAKSRQKFFVRIDWRILMDEPAIPVLQVMDAATAHNDLLYLSYIDPVQSLSKLVPKSEPRDEPQLRRRGQADDQ